MDSQGQIHALWEMFIRFQTREPLRTKSFSLCPPSPPPNSLCSFALPKLIYFHARIIFLRDSGLPNPIEVMRKSRDFHHKAGLCSRQGHMERISPFGNWACALPRELNSLVKPAAGKIRILTLVGIMGRVN